MEPEKAGRASNGEQRERSGAVLSLQELILGTYKELQLDMLGLVHAAKGASVSSD